jgi:hypothetical protein
MEIQFINNLGGGFAGRLEVPEGTTVQQLFEKQMPGCEPADYMIRVDRMPSASDQVLHPDSRVSVTPLKIEGALLAS